MTEDERLDATHRLLTEEFVYRAALQAARRPVPTSLLRFLTGDTGPSGPASADGQPGTWQMPGSG